MIELNCKVVKKSGNFVPPSDSIFGRSYPRLFNKGGGGWGVPTMEAEYQNIGNNKEEPWCCRPCKSSMFPFYGLSNYQFYNFVSSEISATKTKTPQNKTKTIPSSNTHCSVCV